MFKPLSHPQNLNNTNVYGLDFLCSFKFDGIRFSYQDGEVYARSGKLIRNRHIRNTIKNADLPDGIEGELMVGNFQETTSAVMSTDGTPDFMAIVFDMLPDEKNLCNRDRINKLYEKFNEKDLIEYYCGRSFNSTALPWLGLATHEVCSTKEDIDAMMEESKEFGYEGIVLRPVDSKYYDKMYKLKHEKTDEGVIVGFQQLIRKNGEYADQVGAIIVEKDARRFKIGTGLKLKEKIYMWKHQEELIGKIAHYRYDYLSTYGIPRFPRYVGFRHPDDLWTETTDSPIE